jgi:hypothetical protein
MRISLARRARFAAFIGLSALVAVFGPLNRAAAGDDEEKPSVEERIIKNVLGGLGVDVGQGRDIDYRERSPLVIPPSRDLPPPQDAAVVNDPAWPKDPDKQPKKTTVKKRNLGDSVTMYNIQRGTASPDELRGTAAPGTAQGGVTEPKKDAIDNTSEYGGRPLPAAEVSSKKSIFGLSNFFGNKAESAPFTGEPDRTSLTQPPAGYQTPSPEYPYGIGKGKNTSTLDMPQIKDRNTAPNSLGH